MMVILQGSVRHFPPRQLLPFLGTHRHSGTLVVESKEGRARLVFKEGVVVWGESAAGNDIPEIVASMLGEGEAIFTFVDQTEVPAGSTPVSVAVDALLEEAERRALVARTFADDVFFRVVEAPASAEINLKPEQFKLLFRIGSGRTFGELLADGGTTRHDLAAALRTLEASGLLLRGAAGPPAVAVAPAPQPAAPPAASEKPPFLPGPQQAVTSPSKSIAEKPKPARKPSGALTSTEPDATVYPLVADNYSIGREPGNDIVLADSSVSSKHARIARTEDGFTIEDLGSRNGTFVNGEPAKQVVLLADNDMIRLGKIIFTFNVAAELKAGETTQRKLRRS